MRIVLIGFMASGKTTLGKVLATELGLRFVDLDDLVVERTGKTIQNIFSKEGELAFRKYEQVALVEAFKNDDIVLSTGGGAPCFENNLDLLLEKAKVIYLKLPVDSLVNRMLESKVERPLIGGMAKDELLSYVEMKLEERSSYYERANHIIDAQSLTVQELVDKIK